MHVGINQTRHERAIPDVQDSRGRRQRHLRPWSHGNNTIMLNDDDSIVHHRISCPVEQSLRFDGPLHGLCSF